MFIISWQKNFSNGLTCYIYVCLTYYYVAHSSGGGEERICLDTIIRINPFDDLQKYKPTDSLMKDHLVRDRWDWRKKVIGEVMGEGHADLSAVFEVNIFIFNSIIFIIKILCEKYELHLHATLITPLTPCVAPLETSKFSISKLLNA